MAGDRRETCRNDLPAALILAREEEGAGGAGADGVGEGGGV